MTMNLSSEILTEEFKRFNEVSLQKDLIEHYNELVALKLESVHFPPDHSNTDSPERPIRNCTVVSQTLLHRVILLFEGAVSALSDKNIYSLALCIRGHYETTAVLGRLYRRLSSYLNGHISVHDFEKDIYVQTIGCKHPSLSKAPDPKNIMTQLKEADKIFDKEFLGQKKEILRDNYEYLCEFAHPNFHSNTVAYNMDKSKNSIIFRYDGVLMNREFIIGYLDISTVAFIWFFDKFKNNVKKIK